MNYLFILKYTTITGVGTWNYTLSNELIKLGHSVDIWFTVDKTESILTNEFRSIYANVYFTKPNKSYDIVFTNYSININDIPETNSIRHFVHNLMQDDSLNSHSDINYCFGEKSFNYIEGNNILIRNAIDLDKFRFTIPTNIPSKLLLFDSRNNNFTRNILLGIANRHNMYLSILGNDPQYNIEDTFYPEQSICSTDISFAVGRSAIESMAMGKSTIIFNVMNTTGLVTPSNFIEQATTNFSGWLDDKLYTMTDDNVIDYITEQIFNHNVEYLYEIRKLIEKHFDIRKYIDIIIE